MFTLLNIIIIQVIVLVCVQLARVGVVAQQCGTEDALPVKLLGLNQPSKAVAFDGTNAVIGLYLTYPEAVYVFSEISMGNWTKVATLISDDNQDNDRFGLSVGISGTTVMCGAHQTSNTGAVYVFSETSPHIWEQIQRLEASDISSSGGFGASLVIEGTVAIIGASGNTGGVYVFSETSPGNWVEVQKIIRSTNVNAAELGCSMDMYGTTLVVGAKKDEVSLNVKTGFAYIYSETSPGNWVEVQSISASDRSDNDLFGEAVAIHSTTIVVGAVFADHGATTNTGAAYIYSETSPGNWVEVQKLERSDKTPVIYDLFAKHVAFNNLGTILMINCNGDDDPIYGEYISSGAVFLYTETSPGNWELMRKLLPNVVLTSENAVNFGHGMAMWDSMLVAVTNAVGHVYFLDMDNTDQCLSSPCEHGGTCGDYGLLDDFCCSCPAVHDGKTCSECLCENGGVCQDDPDTGIGYCDCSDVNYSGNTCQKSCNNGVGETYPDTGCNCTLSGATGKFCTVDVDDCESNPCANGGTCSDYGADLFPNHNNEFNCSCGSGSPYMGPTCEDTLCYSSPCLHDGSCVNGEDLVCNCTGGYEGEFCQTEIDECGSSPCLNGGVCTDFLGDFTCDCTGTGYEGLACDIDVDDCLSSPCDNDGVCQDKGTYKFKCTCNEFWEGETCSDDVDDCILKGYYCRNGASCTDDPLNLGNVTCHCSAGYIGDYCDIRLDGNTCNVYNPCQNGGYCLSDDESLSCDCAGTGYIGDVCDIFSFNSDCASSPCLHEGRCFDDDTSDYTCDCTDTGYHGGDCEIEYCADVICENGGTCMQDICTCTSDFTGEYCETDIIDGFAAYNRSSSSSSSGIPVFQDANDVSYEIEVDCGSTGKQEIVMIGMAGVSGMAILNWLVLREFPFFKNGIKTSPSTGQRLFFMMLFVFTLFDFITDVGFVDYVTNSCESDLDDIDVFASVAGTVLGVSSMANMLVLLFLTSRDATKSFQKHLSKHTFMTCFAMLVACANLSAILLLDSNLLGLKALTGEFPKELKTKIKLYAMGTGLLQNLPQLITQTTFILQSGISNAATVPSVSFSGILTCITIVRVLMIVCGMLNHDKKAKKPESYELPK